MVDKIKKGSIYAIHHGDYAGQMFCYMEKKEHLYNFLSVPAMKNIKVPEDDLTEGMEKEIVKFVENPPKDVLKVMEAQYKKNEDTNN